MSAMTEELNSCYYGKAYSYEDFSDREAARLLKEIKVVIKKEKIGTVMDGGVGDGESAKS